MVKKNRFKVLTMSTLALALAVGGPAAAFADKKGHDDDHDKKEWNSKSKPAVHSNVNLHLHFKDVNEKQMAWALKYITGLASKDVFSGDGKGNFMPKKIVTRAEAISAAVRLMGLKDQAESAEEKATKLNFTDAKKIEKDFKWAVGYIAVAVENDLFSETETAVHPDKPADRLWATTLLVKALKLQTEAKAKMNTKLNFKDADKIPAGSIGYVAVAVEKNLVSGYTDGTFQPNKPVIRAEFAALMGRTDEQMPNHDNKAINGKVVSVTNNVVKILKSDGSHLDLAVDPGAYIFRKDVRVAVSALVEGDQVVARTFNNMVIFLEVKKEAVQAATFNEVGVVSKINYIGNRLDSIDIKHGQPERETNFQVSNGVRFTNPDKALTVGSVVIISGKNNNIETINVQ
ncbi:hypothetical protein SY83_07390 [Paenibacillus swuensis]|uniref:SLH domain-containing protein n=1 Tax=Paenibacillus swuensis TaxID=1178515 RepID=A0A172TH67_9BACL|nr:S-layer homology domain-containing protein [Paenibacillus swuensis]ANE46133.1 hypothetical protein SY83_07390 [Paenibacillus swuensis]